MPLQADSFESGANKKGDFAEKKLSQNLPKISRLSLGRGVLAIQFSHKFGNIVDVSDSIAGRLTVVELTFDVRWL